MAITDFSVQPLGGFNLGEGVAKLGQQYKQSQALDQQQQEKQQMQDVARKAYGGDSDAIGELFALSPDIGVKANQMNQERLAKMGMLKKQSADKANYNYSTSLKFANTQEEKQAIIDKGIADPESDLFDDSDIGKSIEQMEFESNMSLYSSVGKDAYKELISTDSGLGDQPSAVQETLWFNKQPKDIQDTHLKIKRAEKPTLDEKLNYEKAKAEIKEDTAVSTARKKTTQERVQGYVESGVTSADNFHAVGRSLELLDSVATGGIDAALIAAKQKLGIESANEAELSYELGKSVLKQLKPTFGAAFTVNEMLELKRMEAGLGKSVAGNRRILKNLQKVIKKSAARGLRAAENIGDDFAANEIRIALEGGQSTQQSAGNEGVPEGGQQREEQDIFSQYGIK